MALQIKSVSEMFSEVDRSPGYDVRFKLTGQFVADNTVYPIFNIVRQDIKKDFINCFADVNLTTVQTTAAFYKDILLPNTKGLQVRLTKTFSSNDGLTEYIGRSTVVLYDAVLTHEEDPTLTATSSEDSNSDANDGQLITITLQLIRPYISDIRLVEVGGMFEQTNVKDVLGSLLCPNKKGESASRLSSINYNGLRGIDFYKPTNKTDYNVIKVPMGTRLVHLPSYLQETYGVYSSGIGRYNDNGLWYIYPLMDYTRFRTMQRTLTVVNLSPNEASGIEKTFIIKAQQITVFATGNARHINSSNQHQLNGGNGVTFFKSSELMDGMVRKSGNKSKTNLEQTQRTLSATSRPKGSNVRVAGSKFTENPYKETTELAKAIGSQLIVAWENAAPEILYPGMPVKVLFSDRSTLRSLEGTLLGVDVTVKPATNSLTDNDYGSTALLKLHVKEIE